MDAQAQAAPEMAEEAVVEIQERALTMPERAAAIDVVDAATYAVAGEFLVDVKTLRKEIEAHHAPMIESAHLAHKAALAARKKYDEPLAAAERIVKGALAAYRHEEERKRREREAELRREAERLEEEERLREATRLEEQGKKAQAEAVLERPSVAPVVSLESQTPKVAGVSTRTTWDFEIEDATAIPREYLSIDERKIRGVIRALGAEARIPGVRVFQRTDVAASGRR